MSVNSGFFKQLRERLLQSGSPEELAERLRPRLPADKPLEATLPSAKDIARHGVGFDSANRTNAALLRPLYMASRAMRRHRPTKVANLAARI